MITLTAATPARGREREHAGLAAASAAALFGVCVLVLAVPFEAIEPLLTLPGQALSSAELVLLVALAHLGGGLRARRPVAGVAYRPHLALDGAAGHLADCDGRGACFPRERPAHVGSSCARLWLCTCSRSTASPRGPPCAR